MKIPKSIAALVLSVTAVSIGGCSSTLSAQPKSEPYTLAYVEITGGMCADGGCFSQMTLMSDGGWTTSGSGGDSDGQMNEKDVQAIQDRISEEDIAELEERPDDYTCPTAYDGSMASYKFYGSDGTFQEVDSCSHILEDFVPARIIEEVWSSAE